MRETEALQGEPPVPVQAMATTCYIAGHRILGNEYFYTGGEVQLYAHWYITTDDRRTATCRWRLDGDVGGLTYDGRNYSAVLDEPSYNCDFKATKPGIGVITATWGDLSDSVRITVTE